MSYDGFRAFAGFGTDGEDFCIGITHTDVLGTFFEVKVKIGSYVNLIDQHGVANLEHQRIFQRFVMSLRHREDRHVLDCAGVELGRTNQIAYVLQNDQIDITGIQSFQTLTGHGGIQMAHTAGVELNCFGTGGSNGFGIYIGIDICLHNADF